MKNFPDRRYVDGNFLLFKDKEHTNLFLDYLNQQYPSIKFTSEIENVRIDKMSLKVIFH